MSGKEVEIIQILSSSQGKIAVISALLAGIGYSVLTSITAEDLLNSSLLSVLFLITSTMVVAGNIFVAIICSMSEQEGEVAHAMSILRESRQFNMQLELWWQKFAPLRTQSVWIFYFTVPLLFLSIAILILIKWPLPFSFIVAVLFLIFGAYTTHQIFWLSSIFRSDVLLIETFQEVKYNTKLKRVLSSRDSSRYNTSTLSSEEDSPTPPLTPSQHTPQETSNQQVKNQSQRQQVQFQTQSHSQQIDTQVTLESNCSTKISQREKYQSTIQSSFHFRDDDEEEEDEDASPPPRIAETKTDPSKKILSVSSSNERTPQGQQQYYHLLGDDDDDEEEESDEKNSHLHSSSHVHSAHNLTTTITQRKKSKKKKKQR